MKKLALYFTKPYEVSVREEPPPKPAGGQVLVQTLVSAISAGTELMIYRGQAPHDIPKDETIPVFEGSFNFPFKYGYAAVGRVTALGGGVEPGWLNRLVFAFNPHESHFLACPDDLIPAPSGVSPEIATFLPNMETAVNFVMDGKPLIGEQVAVFGQGVVGLLTTALLARLPLKSLITLDQHAVRRKASAGLGAQTSLTPRDPDAFARLMALLKSEGDYEGADLTYELSGNPAALDKAIEVTGFNGRILIGSWYGQRSTSLYLGGRFHRSRIQLINSQVSTIAPDLSGRWTKTRRLQTASRMLQELNLAPLITHRFPISKASEAYAMLDKHPEQSIQILLTYES